MQADVASLLLHSAATDELIAFGSSDTPLAKQVRRWVELEQRAVRAPKPRDFFIQGITLDGRTFRPSDWAERLAGAMSCFRPGGGAGNAGLDRGLGRWRKSDRRRAGRQCGRSGDRARRGETQPSVARR